MTHRPLGRTGLNVSALSFGASSLGFRVVDEEEGIGAVHVALELGINYFDVAPACGGTRAETVLGTGSSPSATSRPRSCTTTTA